RYQEASQVRTDVETIARTEAGSAKSQPGRSRPTPDVAAASGVENVWRQVKGPGTGLVVTAIFNWLAIPLITLIAFLVGIRTEGHHAYLLLVPLSALGLSSIMLVSGLMMKRLGGYALAIAGAVLAILITPGNLIGLPIGIWALVVLSRREVREGFGKGHPMPVPAIGHSGGAWKVVAVIVAALLLVLAIPIGAIVFSIALPNFLKARNTARLRQQQVQQQIRQQVPTFVVRGTVTDDGTGRPVAGARVDDNAYGARPNRPPQQAWTDAQGHYELRTWHEEHALTASAPGYQTTLETLTTSRLAQEQPAQIDFRLQPQEGGDQAASAPEIQALDESVKRGSEAWTSGDFSKALALLLPAALKGNPVAQHRIGVMYVMGQGVEQDLAEATRWFRKAAEQGQGESEYSMGLRYLWGQSVAQDDQEAARWLKLAADQGVAPAAAALKNRYANGEGVSRDLVEACKWGIVAGAQNDPTTSDTNLTDLEDKLTPAQLAEAQRRAKAFVPKRTGPADP